MSLIEARVTPEGVEHVELTDDQVLAMQGPAERRLIPKSVVQERLITLGKAIAADAALEADKVAKFRWFAPNHPNVYADDPGLLDFLAALLLTPEEVEVVTAP